MSLLKTYEEVVGVHCDLRSVRGLPAPERRWDCTIFQQEDHVKVRVLKVELSPLEAATRSASGVQPDLTAAFADGFCVLSDQMAGAPADEKLLACIDAYPNAPTAEQGPSGGASGG